jgi:hypothetical protein
MSPYDFVFAVALLTAPVEAPEPASNAAVFARLQPTLQFLAVKWEILDIREVKYVLSRPEDFAADLQLLRRRFHDLADAPGVGDSFRFPDRATITEMLAFNRSYRNHIDVRQPLELANWWELKEIQQETDRLHQIWDTVRDARCEYYYVTVRRQALKKLHEMVGADAYFTGCLPPHVPVWRFRQID